MGNDLNSRKRTASETIAPVVPPATSSVASRVLEEAEVISQMTTFLDSRLLTPASKAVSGASTNPTGKVRRKVKHMRTSLYDAKQQKTTSVYHRTHLS